MRLLLSALPALASNYGAEERDAPVFHNSTATYTRATCYGRCLRFPATRERVNGRINRQLFEACKSARNRPDATLVGRARANSRLPRVFSRFAFFHRINVGRTRTGDDDLKRT